MYLICVVLYQSCLWCMECGLLRRFKLHAEAVNVCQSQSQDVLWSRSRLGAYTLALNSLHYITLPQTCIAYKSGTVLTRCLYAAPAGNFMCLLK